MITHAQLRAKERHGIMLTGKVVGEIVRQIAAGDVILLGVQPNGHVRYLVRVGERAIIIVYAPDANFIVSVLPRNAHAQRRGEPPPPAPNKFATRRRRQQHAAS